MTRRIIALLLVFATLLTLTTFGASAASEEYISEVALVYEDTLEEAKAAIAGTDWKIFEQDLNPNADYVIDDGVFLIYKTSTNVEDAITDLRVMDMYGGFSISNYEKQLEASRAEYKRMADYVRTAAAEFKALYEAGDPMALLAYRQMNYYKDSDTGMLMGEFMLNFPTDDAFITVMMEGNSIIVSNLISLLAVGLADAEHSLAERVNELYAIRDTLTDTEYYNDAEALNSALEALAAKIKRYDTLEDKYNLYDEEMGEEEYSFVKDFATIALLTEGIQLGDVTLAGLLRKGNWSMSDLYPLVAAFSDGQMALIRMGAFETILKYATPSDSVEALNEVLAELEKELTDENGNIKVIDLYMGVDRSIFKGNFAMTNAAERRQALTGETWDMGSAAAESLPYYIAGGIAALLDVVAWGCFAAKLSSVPAGAAFYQITYTKISFNLAAMLEVEEAGKVGMAVKEITTSTGVNSAGIFFWTAIALALVVAGLTGISTWYNYYNPNYTAIPDTMVDVVETDLGDKYVKYTVAKVYNDADGRNADFNAYEGKEWNALYYTKDATAGNCLLPKFVHKDNDSSIARRHQGISMFGETEAFNLNSHAYSKNAPGVYVTMRYSTAKKAAADVPSVVGSMFATGAFYALTAIGGAGVGVGATILIQKGKKKKEEPDTEPSQNQ